MNKLDRLRAQRRKSTPVTVAAPIKGWNTRDPFEAMDPLDAIVLDNWYPDFAGVNLRNGSLNFATGLGPLPVKTLASFRSGSTSKFLAACNLSIFDITAGGSTLTPVAAGFQSDIWQTVLFNRHQFWVNGSDPAQIYDGTTMAATGFTGTSMATMNGVGAFNNRLYFWTGTQTGFWYGPVLGISGALSFFDFSMATETGGNLTSVATLSYDGGTGINNYTCFFLSSGEVLLYSGTDPSNASNWAKVGSYLLPRPVALRAMCRYGGDIYFTTSSDHQQLSKLLIALKLGEVPPPTKATGAVKTAWEQGVQLQGWQALYYPAGRRMMFNIPNPDGTFSQHVYNTSTNAWCRFNGMKAYCWAIYQDSLYYGSDTGAVIQADTGLSDNGSAIVAQGQQAWQLFETPLKKRVTAVRPVIQANASATFNFGLGFDYQDAGISIPDTAAIANNALVWGASRWGTPTVWGADGVTDSRWHIAGGEGGAIGISLGVSASVKASWVRTDVMIEPGSAL